MCKTGKKKLKKINFYEFILFYWKMKKKSIYIYIFYGLPIGGKNEKKNE